MWDREPRLGWCSVLRSMRARLMFFMTTTIAVLREMAPGEQRVALVPDSVQRLVKLGLRVQVEASAGEAASIGDADYERAGAVVLAGRVAAVAGADVLLKVQGPSTEEIQGLPSGSLLIGFLQGRGSGTLDQLAARRVDAMAMERVPRTTRAQAVDALSSQATVAGYKAVLLGASMSPRLLPMLTTAAGTLTPAKVLVLGAGVAGLQAIATAKRLGAVVSAFDVRAAAPGSSRWRGWEAPGMAWAVTRRSWGKSSSGVSSTRWQGSSGTRIW